MTLLDKYRDLPLSFGGASISGEGGGYGFGNINEDEAISLLRLASDRGVKVFDTAPIYGFSLSEKRIGMAFRQMRDKVFIVSKSGVTWHENRRVDMNNDPKIARKMLEQSLIDLNTDYIDLYMVHWPDSKFDIRSTLEVFDKALHEKKILNVGLCNTNIEELNKAFEVCPIKVVQSEFNYFENKAKSDLFPYLKENKISFMSWGSLDKGILTGRVDKDRKFDSSDCRSWAPWWKSQNLNSKFLEVQKLKSVCEKHQVDLLTFALSYNYSHEEISTMICGARNETQLNSLLNAMENLIDKVKVNSILKEVQGDGV
jgi:aryl-alcohol dehydrogenase-like predicted oxidoreductase